MNLKCFSCGKEITVLDNKVGIREECPHCRADAHVCKNCEFYDPKVYNECRETSAEVVREKDRANRCDYFQISTRDVKSLLRRRRQPPYSGFPPRGLPPGCIG